MVNRALDQERVKDSLKTIDSEVLRLGKLRKKLFPDSPPRVTKSKRPNTTQSNIKDVESPPKTSWKEQNNVTMTQNLHRELVASSQSNLAIGRILKKLFTFYVSFGDRLNTSFIRTAQVYRILEDSDVLSREIDQRDVEILFYKHSNNQANIDFVNFLDMMIDVAELKFPPDKDEKALIKLFEKHLRPLYASIYMNTEIGEFDTIFKEPLDKNALFLLWNAESPLRSIYKRSFPLEFFRGNLEEYGLRAYIQKSDNSCFNLLKDFNISPGLISKSLANSLYQSILDTSRKHLTSNPSLPNVLQDPKSDLGRRFTFSRFLVFLARLAMIAYSTKNAKRTSSDTAGNLQPVHSLLLLFERMEFSKGFVEYERSLHSTHNSTHRILPTKAFIQKLLNNEINESNAKTTTSKASPEKNSPERFYLSNSLTPSPVTPQKRDSFQVVAARKKSVVLMQPIRKQSPTEKVERKRKKEVDPRVQLRPQAKAVLDSKQNFIRKIFKHFSVFNSKINKYCLPSLKFLTILKQAEILHEGGAKGSDMKRAVDKKKVAAATSGLSSIDVDIITSQVCGHMKQEESHHVPQDNLNTRVRRASYFQPIVKPRFAVPDTKKEPATSKKLEYEQFLKIIELMAEKLSPNMQLGAAVENIITQHLMKIKLIQADASLQLSESLQTLQGFVSLVNTPEMEEILKKLQESMRPYYKAYADRQHQINLEGFVRFAKDYCIFPHIIIKEKVIKIFNHFAMVHPVMKANRVGTSPNTEKPKINPAELVHNEFVDENTFTAALISCAVQVQKEEGVEKHPIEKIAYLLDTMSNAPGPRAFHISIEPARLSPLSYFEVLGFIRHKYRGLLGIDSNPTESMKKGERVRRIFTTRSSSPKKDVYSIGQLSNRTPSPQRDKSHYT